MLRSLFLQFVAGVAEYRKNLTGYNQKRPISKNFQGSSPMEYVQNAFRNMIPIFNNGLSIKIILDRDSFQQ